MMSTLIIASLNMCAHAVECGEKILINNRHSVIATDITLILLLVLYSGIVKL